MSAEELALEFERGSVPVTVQARLSDGHHFRTTGEPPDPFPVVRPGVGRVVGMDPYRGEDARVGPSHLHHRLAVLGRGGDGHHVDVRRPRSSGPGGPRAALPLSRRSSRWAWRCPPARERADSWRGVDSSGVEGARLRVSRSSRRVPADSRSPGTPGPVTSERVPGRSWRSGRGRTRWEDPRRIRTEGIGDDNDGRFGRRTGPAHRWPPVWSPTPSPPGSRALCTPWRD